jgi:Dyp-type peroxidase family
MPVDLSKPLDDIVLSNSEKSFMKGLQANILKGHGREHVALVFLKIRDVAKARAWLRDYPVTDAYTQHLETQAYGATKVPGGVVRLVHISSSGLKAFGQGAAFAGFGAFSGGMAVDTSVLDDGNTSSWEPGFAKGSDVLLLLAYHCEVDLARIVRQLTDEFAEKLSPFDVVYVQDSRAYKNKDSEGLEHFGYVDGRSQPLMTQSDIQHEKAKGGIDRYDPSAPLGQFLLPDPLSPTEFGSFFVFRKLEQNVAGFKRQEQLTADAEELKGEDRELAGAQAVGRFEDGTPVTLSQVALGGAVQNNFNYDADPAGSKCPFHAHIRKTNPRGSSPGGLTFDKSVQMARRGITYGSRVQDPNTKAFIDQPFGGVGLLFMSYQASIEAQFQFMQTQWANNENFPKPGVGIDPVIGQGPSTLAQTWPSNGKKFLFRGFVTLKGGEYFYTPSLAGLKNL